MAASLAGAGAVQADATAGHPSKQLGHRQATSRARIDGRATRRLAGPRHPATCPPIWAGREAGARPAPSRSSHEYCHPGPRDSRAGRRRRPERAPPQGPAPAGLRPRSSASAPLTACGSRGQGGLPDIGSPQARGAVDTRDYGSVARTPRQRTRSTASSGTVRAPAASPRGRLGPGARGVRPAPARTHEPGRIVPYESIGLGCPRGGRRLWPG
jgi:hypothetical protein